MAGTGATWTTRSLETPLQDEFLLAQRWGLTNLGTYNPKSRLPSGGMSDHARYPARAFDVGGRAETLERFFQAMVNRPGIEYVIYRDKIWSRTRGLHEYTSGGHETHVHVSGTPGAKPGTPPASDRGYKGPLADVPVLGPAGRGATRGLDWILSPIDKGIDVAKKPFEVFEWISGNWDRVLEVVAGFILLLVGLILLGRSMGVGGRRLGGDLANRLQYGPTVVQASPGVTRTVRVHDVSGSAPRRPSSGYNPETAEIPF